MQNIFKQEGVVNLSVDVEFDAKVLLHRIEGALLSHGATEIEMQGHSIQFVGGSNPFEANYNPLMPISSGSIEVFPRGGIYYAKYSLSLMHLLFWCGISSLVIFIVVFLNNQLLIHKVFGGLGACVFALFFVYLGYYGTTTIRFPNLIKRAVKKGVSS